MIPKPKNPKPCCSQPSIPLPIIRISPAVLSAVHFDHHFLFQTHKVNDIGSAGSLPAKFVAVNLAQPQVPHPASPSHLPYPTRPQHPRDAPPAGRRRSDGGEFRPAGG